MVGIYFLLPTLLVVFISLLVVRTGAIALMMTGLDEKKAKFQALSAFSGTGFTTREAESVTSNPKRRRIITYLMIWGNAGIVTVIVTATSSLVSSREDQLPIDILFLLAGLLVIYKLATHKGFIRRWENFIEDRFVQSGIFEEAVTEDLLHLIEGYGLLRVIVKEDSPVIGRSVAQLHLTEKGLLVLGIERSISWIPIPRADETVQNGDKLIVYGALKALRMVFGRRET